MSHRRILFHISIECFVIFPRQHRHVNWPFVLLPDRTAWVEKSLIVSPQARCMHSKSFIFYASYVSNPSTYKSFNFLIVGCKYTSILCRLWWYRNYQRHHKVRLLYIIARFIFAADSYPSLKASNIPLNFVFALFFSLKYFRGGLLSATKGFFPTLEAVIRNPPLILARLEAVLFIRL